MFLPVCKSHSINCYDDDDKFLHGLIRIWWSVDSTEFHDDSVEELYISLLNYLFNYNINRS